MVGFQYFRNFLSYSRRLVRFWASAVDLYVRDVILNSVPRHFIEHSLRQLLKHFSGLLMNLFWIIFRFCFGTIYETFFRTTFRASVGTFKGPSLEHFMEHIL